MHSQAALQKIKNAVALIEAPDANPPRRGTAYLISKSQAVTCYHTLNGMKAGGRVTMQFSHGQYHAELVSFDPANDCALLRLLKEVEVAPLKLGEAQERALYWEAMGYPSVALTSGVPIKGTILDVEGEDLEHAPAIVLEAPTATGQPLAGFSGSPVLINERVIGHLKSNIERYGSENSLGILYACHSRYVSNLLPKSVEQRQQVPPGVGYNKDLYLSRRGQDQRPIEPAIINDMVNGKRVTVICGPVRFGKTWTLSRLRDLLQEQHPQYGVATLPAKEWVRSGDSDGSFFFRQFALRLCQEVGLPEEVVGRTWSTRAELLPEDRVERILSIDILRKFSQERPLVLLMDQLDAVLNTAMGNSTIEKLRAWVERSELPLRFLGTLSTTPALLQASITGSPFNIDDGVDLPELDDEQIGALCTAYGLGWSAAERALLRDWIGGHPYLVRLALHKAAREHISPSELFNRENPAFLIFKNFIIYLTSKLGSQDKLIALWRALLDGRSVNDSSANSEFIKLWRAGLIRYDASMRRYAPRYKLYTLVDSPLLLT